MFLCTDFARCLLVSEPQLDYLCLQRSPQGAVPQCSLLRRSHLPLIVYSLVGIVLVDCSQRSTKHQNQTKLTAQQSNDLRSSTNDRLEQKATAHSLYF